MIPRTIPLRRLMMAVMPLTMLLISAVGPAEAVQITHHSTPTPSPDTGPEGIPTRPASISPRATPTPVPEGGPFVVVDSPNVPDLHNRLNAVAAISATDVWAVGETYNYNGSSRQTLIEHWDGSSWQIVASPNAETGSNRLLGVSAVSASDIWAVGRYGGNSGPNWQPILLHYDGSGWSLDEAPSTGSGAAELNAVAARVVDDVWAVGSYVNASTNWWEQPLIMHYDGTAWSIVPSPQVGTSSILYGVTAIAPDDVWAVGSTLTNNYEALILHWDGSTWSQIPANAGSSSGLFAVAAVSGNNVWAVGSKNNGSGTLILHWGGSVWSVVASPNGNYSGANRNALAGLAVNSAGDVWAVGSSAYSGLCGGSDASHYWSKSLALHWDGTSWEQVLTENPGPAGGCNTPRNDFYSVTTAGGVPITVGAYYEPSLSVQQFRTLVEQGQ